MYKRFIRWTSDRLADNGIIAFITNRAYLEEGRTMGSAKRPRMRGTGNGYLAPATMN